MRVTKSRSFFLFLTTHGRNATWRSVSQILNVQNSLVRKYKNAVHNNKSQAQQECFFSQKEPLGEIKKRKRFTAEVMQAKIL